MLSNTKDYSVDLLFNRFSCNNCGNTKTIKSAMLSSLFSVYFLDYCPNCGFTVIPPAAMLAIACFASVL